MKRRCIAAVALALLAATFVGPEAGAGSKNRAGVVVQHGDGATIVHCVKFSDEISGYKLVKKSHFKAKTADYGGGLGHAVCYLDGEGPKTGRTDQCFSDPDGNFWAYWNQEETGGPPTPGAGIDGRVVTNGDVDYWVWGQSGGPPNYDPPPPNQTFTFEEICPSE